MQQGKRRTKRQGLTLEEKASIIESWFAAHPQPFTVKELTALIPKQTPVLFQCIEECLALLVAENRVCQEKIGISTLYWLFPLTEKQRESQMALAASGRNGASNPRSSVVQLLQGRSDDSDRVSAAAAVEKYLADATLEELKEVNGKQVEEAAQLDSLMRVQMGLIGEEGEAGAEADMQQISAITTRCLQLLEVKKRLSAGADLPRVMQQLQKRTRIALDAANRWTDNYFLIEAAVVAKSWQNSRDLRASLHIPLDLDFIPTAEFNLISENARETSSVDVATIPSASHAAGSLPQSHCLTSSQLPSTPRLRSDLLAEVEAGAVAKNPESAAAPSDTKEIAKAVSKTTKSTRKRGRPSRR